jgi:ATP-dependent helicase/nuclease subunit A
MRTPNSEQKRAIEHDGGFLLRAGAGSGKTFVIVEHVIFWIHNLKKSGLGDEEVVNSVKSCVIVTFTKKATREIRLRLYERLLVESKKAVAESVDRGQFWQDLAENIELLNVSTLDGFFYRLVRDSLIPQLDPKIAISSETILRATIKKFFWKRFNAHEYSAEFHLLMAQKKDSVLNALLDLDQNPESKMNWLQSLNFCEEDNNQFNQPHFIDEVWIQEVSQLHEWNYFFDFTVPAVVLDKKKPKKWQLLLEGLSRFDRSCRTIDDLERWAKFLESDLGKTRVIKKDMSPEVFEFFESWAIFKKSMNETCGVVEAYKKNQNKIASLVKDFSRALIYLEELKRSLSKILTYADLEFEVSNALKDKQVLQAIQKKFHYFIIDEFQDTSTLQFDIISRIVDFDAKKLFCVGDAKQAIYGFRGGDWLVFRRFMDLKNANSLELVINYRSSPEIISLNNQLFEKLFPLGKQGLRRDVLAVAMEKQSSQHTVTQKCFDLLTTTLSQTSIHNESDLKDIESVEASVIVQYLQESFFSNSEMQTATVLYKKLASALPLVERLLQEKVSFSAQCKIKTQNNPLHLIFVSLVESLLKENNYLWPLEVISHLLSLWNVKKIDFESSLKLFFKDYSLFGLMSAFKIFLARIGFSQTETDESFDLIKKFIELFGDNIESLYHHFQDVLQSDISYEMSFQEGQKKLIIQTVHASKGLEYDLVIIGGAWTNGRSRYESLWFGKDIGAFSYFVENEKLQTPKLYSEALRERMLSFSESKRLLYVAMTRAKKKLAILNFQNAEGIAFEPQSSSWAEAFELSGIQAIPHETYSFSFSDNLIQFTGNPFHRHSLNVNFHQQISFWKVLPDLSVTKIARLAACPRWLYFQDVLKIDGSQFESEILASKSSMTLSKKDSQSSSASRGTLLHKYLEEALSKDIEYGDIEEELQLMPLTRRDRRIFESSLNKVRESFTSPVEFETEKVLRFHFFQIMISGIPDLICRTSDAVSVWDFKTGASDKWKNQYYWVQLKVYALGLWELGIVNQVNEINLVIFYVDENQLFEKSISFTQATNELREVWNKLANLSEVNTQSCHKCPYTPICDAANSAVTCG